MLPDIDPKIIGFFFNHTALRIAIVAMVGSVVIAAVCTFVGQLRRKRKETSPARPIP